MVESIQKLAVYVYKYDYEIHSLILFVLLIIVSLVNNLRDFINNFLNEEFSQIVTIISKYVYLFLEI